MDIAARGGVSWPCHSFMQLAGSLDLDFGPAADFGSLHLSLTVHCQDPEAGAYTLSLFGST
jgi:hypothetical protein